MKSFILVAVAFIALFESFDASPVAQYNYNRGMFFPPRQFERYPGPAPYMFGQYSPMSQPAPSLPQQQAYPQVQMSPFQMPPYQMPPYQMPPYQIPPYLMPFLNPYLAAAAANDATATTVAATTVSATTASATTAATTVAATTVASA